MPRNSAAHQPLGVRQQLFGQRLQPSPAHTSRPTRASCARPRGTRQSAPARSPSRSSGVRTLASNIDNISRSISPRRISRTGGMRIPSWKISRAGPIDPAIHTAYIRSDARATRDIKRRRCAIAGRKTGSTMRDVRQMRPARIRIVQNGNSRPRSHRQRCRPLPQPTSASSPDAPACDRPSQSRAPARRIRAQE